MTFALHPKLTGDTIAVVDLPVCRVLLMNNSLFPWLILVPRREHLREWTDLSAADYPIAMDEIRHVAAKFAQLTGAYKMNIASLGNMVEQLHIHVIARYVDDPAWPQPIWGHNAAAVPYAPEDVQATVERIRRAVEAA